MNGISAAPALTQETTTRPITLATDGAEIGLEVPLVWVKALGTPANILDVRSSLNLPIGVGEWQRVRLEVRPLEAPFGELPAEDEIGKYMELLLAALPLQSEYPPDLNSQVARFTWQSQPAAVFLTYSQGGQGRPAYYARWWGLQISAEQVLILEQGMTLPAGIPPDPRHLANFDQMLATLRLGEILLGAEDAQTALARLTDPYTLAGAVTATLQLRNGLEVRVAAPQGWISQDVTQSVQYPTTYFFEDDLRVIPEGDPLKGILIQISLLSADRLQSLLETDDLPTDQKGDLALAYLNALIPLSAEGLVFGSPQEWAWTDEYYALLLPIEYPSAVALHADGTHQELVLVEVQETLILFTLYTPDGRWSQARPIWQNILMSLTINGEGLPSEPITTLFQTLAEE